MLVGQQMNFFGNQTIHSHYIELVASLL